MRMKKRIPRVIGLRRKATWQHRLANLKKQTPSMPLDSHLRRLLFYRYIYLSHLLLQRCAENWSKYRSLSPNKNRPLHTEGGLRNPQNTSRAKRCSYICIYINFIATEQPKHGGVWDVLVIPNPVFNRKLGKICGIERMRKC